MAVPDMERIEARRTAERRIAEALGLDPNETTAVRIDVEAGRPAVVKWQGCRRIPVEKVAELLEAAGLVVDDGAGDRP